MPVPKRRKSKSARDMRRAQHNISAVKSVVCPQCNEAKLPHRVCAACGYYNGREIIAAPVETAAQ